MRLSSVALLAGATITGAALGTAWSDRGAPSQAVAMGLLLGVSGGTMMGANHFIGGAVLPTAWWGALALVGVGMLVAGMASNAPQRVPMPTDYISPDFGY